MLRNLIRVSISLLIFATCCSSPNVSNRGDEDVYLDMTVKYEHNSPLLHLVLRESLSLSRFLRVELDSIIIDDSIFVNSFMERVISSDRSPVVYDPYVIDGVDYSGPPGFKLISDINLVEIVEPEIDVLFVAFARTADKVDTLSFGIDCITYNETWFRDSTLYNSLLSVIKENNSSIQQR